MEQMLDEGSRETCLEQLRDADAGFEYLLNALRLREGFSEAAFCETTGLKMDAIEAPLARAKAEGLIEESGNGVWRPTALGFRFLNELQARFLP